MNKLLRLSGQIALASSLVVILPCQAADVGPFELSANVSLTTDYVYRGLSYTNEEPAIHGAFKIEHESGAYVSTWATHVNFLEDDTVKPDERASFVIGWYAGYNADLNDNLNYDIQVASYAFPGADDDLNYPFSELNGVLTYTIQDTDLGLIYSFSPDFFLKSDQAHYYELNAAHTFTKAYNLEIGGRVGRQTVKDNDTVGFDDYSTYGVWASYPIGDWTATLEYVSTDLDNAEALNADGKFIFTIGF